MATDRNGHPNNHPDWSLTSEKVVDFQEIGGLTTATQATAALSTNLTGDENDLVFTSTRTGQDAPLGNSTTVAYIDPSENDAVLSVEVTDADIVVNLATDENGDITSTANEVMEAVLANEDAAALVTVALKASNDGTGVVTAMAETALSGGANGPLKLFTVTGAVRMKLLAICDADVAGASATLTAGTATTALIAQTTAANIDANEIWHDNSPDASVELDSVLASRIVSDDIVLTAGTAGVTGGKITFSAIWYPLTEGAKVVATEI